MPTTLDNRWGKLGSLQDVPKLKEISEALGQDPEVTTTTEPVVYKPRIFQVIVGENSIFIHASLLRRFGTRQVLKFMEDCNTPSDWRRANPRR